MDGWFKVGDNGELTRVEVGFEGGRAKTCHQAARADGLQACYSCEICSSGQDIGIRVDCGNINTGLSTPECVEIKEFVYGGTLPPSTSRPTVPYPSGFPSLPPSLLPTLPYPSGFPSLPPSIRPTGITEYSSGLPSLIPLPSQECPIFSLIPFSLP
jgi:hypothetical protein